MNLYSVYTTLDHSENINTLLREGKQKGYVDCAVGSIFFIGTKDLVVRYVFLLDETKHPSSILLLKLSGYSISKGPAVGSTHIGEFAVY